MYTDKTFTKFRPKQRAVRAGARALDRHRRPFLSVVIPAFNEEKRLPGTLQTISAYLEQQSYEAEVIVVENGSTDRTVEIVQTLAAGLDNLRLISTDTRGKGHAVKLGMLQARGEFAFLCDADLSMPISELDKFLPPALDGYDIAIGSREALGAQRFGEPRYRHLMGRVYARIVQLLAVPEYADTQCGFKVFRRSVVRSLFERQTLNGWGFDPELLYIARKRGYRIVEIPIRWYYNPESRVRPIHDSLHMVVELLRIRWNDLRGLY